MTETQKSKGVTYHSLKDTNLMKGLHKQLLESQLKKLLDKTSKLRQEVASMKTILSLDKVTFHFKCFSNLLRK